MASWWIYKGIGEPHGGIERLPPSPSWRQFNAESLDEYQHEPHADPQSLSRDVYYGRTYQASEKEINLVNAALYLRRPLLVTGNMGTGKSSLAYAVAYELQLGQVLHWPLTSRSTLQDGLYLYDAIGRVQEANLKKQFPDIGQFIRLGPLGTALLPTKRPRVLLIDDIERSDFDFPNDLLTIFAEGGFDIPELVRISGSHERVQILPYDSQKKVTISQGRILCHAFPFVVITTSGERDLPPLFLRQCLNLNIDDPSSEKLTKIVQAHFEDLDEDAKRTRDLIVKTCLDRRAQGELATDQLLNTIYLVMHNAEMTTASGDQESLLSRILHYLDMLEAP